MGAELPMPPVPAEVDKWRRIPRAAWRSLKASIVAAALAGAISAVTARRLIARFNLKDL